MSETLGVWGFEDEMKHAFEDNLRTRFPSIELFFFANDEWPTLDTVDARLFYLSSSNLEELGAEAIRRKQESPESTFILSFLSDEALPAELQAAVIVQPVGAINAITSYFRARQAHAERQDLTQNFSTGNPLGDALRQALMQGLGQPIPKDEEEDQSEEDQSEQ